MTNLVDSHLERIPADVFVKFQEAIKNLASKQHGVYALYQGSKLYYVGLAKNLKSRVQQHLKDQHKGKWDTFSLYLIRHEEHLKELETLVIHIAAPAGNTLAGKFAKSTNLRPRLKKLAMESVKTMFGRKPLAATPPKKRLPPKQVNMNEPPLKGYLPEGTIIRSVYKGRQTEATITEVGRVLLNGKLFNSPSAAAMSLTIRPADGWLFWRYQDENGKWVKIDELRKNAKAPLRS